jgi:hypothetical protein
MSGEMVTFAPPIQLTACRTFAGIFIGSDLHGKMETQEYLRHIPGLLTG